MHLSIRARLFLTLLLASLIATLGTAAFVRWSMQRGLAELLDARESERIGEIAERLAALSGQDGSWQPLREDKRLWVAALMGRGDWSEGERAGARPRHLPRWLRRDLGGGRTWPPDHALERLAHQGGGEGPPLPLPLRLMLLDRAGELVYGREALLPGTRRIPIERAGETVGTLALLPGPPLPELPELELQNRLGRRLGLIALGMVAVSAALAYLLARRLVRPVRGIQETAQRLAAGDYGARVQPQGHDEIARLGRDIDALASTLERNEQARRRWVADIAHELRTPIALLRAELEAIQDGVRPLDRARVDALHGDALRLARLVDDLHDLSVTDLGALSYRMAPTDPGEVLGSDLDAFRPRFAEAGLDLSFADRRPAPGPIRADPERLSQLFRNLLRNSLQYTDSGGALAVALTREGERLAIDFQDSAPGVPAESLPRLFDRLYRVEQSRSRHSGGAGLGLAIAKNVAEAHGGSICARPSPTGGLWIRVELPAE
jgi:two-component system sensor histidine kinase BaeS